MRRFGALLVVSLVVSLGACTGGGGSGKPSASPAQVTLDPGPTCIKVKDSTACFPIAPAARRVDLVRPMFSKPLSITNPLHPTSAVKQVIMLGAADGSPFRSEVTLLPQTKTIEWNGQRVETVVSQYVAYVDGRIEEVALDWYAQADDGSVWYFGEDVFNFDDGVVSDTEGTWLAGKDGPAAMIMPARPKVGDVYRPENIPGLVFEEVTVKAVDQTVPGPRGPVTGAMTASELHMDLALEDKIFAPGYGEFLTGSGANVEALALAVPTDAVPGPSPAQLGALAVAAVRAFDAAGREDWAGVSAAQRALLAAWAGYRAGGVPPRLDAQMRDALSALGKGAQAREGADTQQAALDVGLAVLDLRLRHEPVVTIDAGRLGQWGRRLLVDAQAREPGDVAGDVETLERIFDRVRHAVEPGVAARVDGQLTMLAGLAAKKDAAAVERAAPALVATFATVRPR